MKHSTHSIKLAKDQRGLVSFLVVIVIMAILTLIVVAYAQITRREQRQALDRQLNSQAFYAAESGVNDAMRALKANATLADTDYTDCEGDDSFMKAAGLDTQSTISSEGPVSYSCLLVDASPEQLSYDNIPVGGSQVIPIRAKGGGGVSVLGFSWINSSKGQTGDKTGCPTKADVENGAFIFKSSPDKCGHPVLRIELVPFAGNRNRSQLIEERAIFFAQPVRDDVGSLPLIYHQYTQALNLENQGLIVPALCSASAQSQDGLSRCSVNIKDLPASFTGYVRVTPMYYPAQVWVTGYDASNNDIEFTGAQVEIDVTGKANDILKRIRVHRSLGESTNSPIPGYALQSTKTQCKLFSISGGAVTIGADAGSLRDLCDPTE